MLRAPPPELVTAELRRFVARLYQSRASGTVTSWWRSPSENARVGGVPRSLHLRALAIDFVPRGSRLGAITAFRRVGLRVLDEGDHLHVSL
jgi:uncharacterized protein YcbK (DUF882 family)